MFLNVYRDSSHEDGTLIVKAMNPVHLLPPEKLGMHQGA